MRRITVLIAGLAVLPLSMGSIGVGDAAGSDRAAGEPPAAIAPRDRKPGASADALKPLAFLAGAWSSEVDGALTEEHWSQPHGTSIVGMFRWCKPDGSPSMFEILTITAEGEGVLLRLRHFSPALVAKEDKDKPMVLRLESATANAAVFVAHSDTGTLSRITYRSPTADRLAIEIDFTQESKRPPLKFDLKRQIVKG